MRFIMTTARKHLITLVHRRPLRPAGSAALSSSRKRLITLGCFTVLAAGCDAGRPLRLGLSDTSLAHSSFARSGAPTDALISTVISSSRIDLAWPDYATSETGWEIHRSSDPGGGFMILVKTAANVTSYSDVGLSPLSQYCYRVRSFKTSGRKTTNAEFSNTTCSTTPGAPLGASEADSRPANSSAVDVSWRDNSETEDGFRIERSASSSGPWEVATTTSANVQSYRDEGRISEQRICHRVVAFNAHGASEPSSAHCTTPPRGPLALTATGLNKTAELTWVDNSSTEDAYEVLRAQAESGPYGVRAVVASNSTSYRDEGLSGNTTYWYRVRATKDGGFSDVSNTASAATGNCSDRELVCDDGADNDCDGFVDSADPDCSAGCGGIERECNNSADDDCDGLVDGADPDCPPPPCESGCPAGMTCIGDFCYYWPDADQSDPDGDSCQDPGAV